MGPVVEFYYGIGSRYSYLASTQLDALERDTGCRVVWRPLYSSDLMLRRGMHPFRHETTPSGQYDWQYRTYDAECWAAYYGVPYVEPPEGIKEFHRYALACVAADRLDACAVFSKALFAAVFTEGRNVIDDTALADIAVAAGLDSAALMGLIDDTETAGQHEKNIEDALAAGAFGVPTFAVDGKMFWGNDRLVLLRHHLQSQSV
jgi:2-hydroxychromene-2-carboxylate isomerase